MNDVKRSFCKSAVVGCFALAMSTSTTTRSCAQESEVMPIQIGYRTPYAIAKPVISSSFSVGSSLDRRRAAVMRAAEVGNGRRAGAALGNSIEVLAKTPGGESLTQRFAVDNPFVRKGALRAARLAGALDVDLRFKVVALDQPNVPDEW